MTIYFIHTIVFSILIANIMFSKGFFGELMRDICFENPDHSPTRAEAISISALLAFTWPISVPFMTVIGLSIFAHEKIFK